MKTRADIYGNETAELLRLVSLYPGIRKTQLLRFFPAKPDMILNLLSHLTKQGRICISGSENYFPAGLHDAVPDRRMIQAVWVLLDFIEQTEFHSPSDFPVNVIFFVAGELYEIISVPTGQEMLIAGALLHSRHSDSRRIVIVEDTAQIAELDFPGISGFCTVESEGQIHYYQKTNGGI